MAMKNTEQGIRKMELGMKKWNYGQGTESIKVNEVNKVYEVNRE